MKTHVTDLTNWTFHLCCSFLASISHGCLMVSQCLMIRLFVMLILLQWWYVCLSCWSYGLAMIFTTLTVRVIYRLSPLDFDEVSHTICNSRLDILDVWSCPLSIWSLLYVRNMDTQKYDCWVRTDRNILLFLCFLSHIVYLQHFFCKTELPWWLLTRGNYIYYQLNC